MALLKYYRLEALRHHDVQSVAVTEVVIRQAVREMLAHHNLPPIPVKFHQDKSTSSSESVYTPGHDFLWRPIPGREHITFSRNMKNWLIVCHEVAHCIHFHAQKVKFREHKASGTRLPFMKERWHGMQHQAIVDSLVSYCKRHGWIAGF